MAREIADSGCVADVAICPFFSLNGVCLFSAEVVVKGSNCPAPTYKTQMLDPRTIRNPYARPMMWCVITKLGERNGLVGREPLDMRGLRNIVLCDLDFFLNNFDDIRRKAEIIAMRRREFEGE